MENLLALALGGQSIGKDHVGISHFALIAKINLTVEYQPHMTDASKLQMAVQAVG